MAYKHGDGVVKEEVAEVAKKQNHLGTFDRKDILQEVLNSKLK